MSGLLNIVVLPMHDYHFTWKNLEDIKAIAPNAAVSFIEEDSIQEGVIKSAEIIFGWPRKEQLAQAENLRWLHLPSAGADGYTSKSTYCSSIIVTNSSGVFGIPIAEHVMGLMLAFSRNLNLYSVCQANREWKRLSVRKDIYNSTVGIIGLGDIGSEVAIRSKAFGARIIAVKRIIIHKPDYVDELYTFDGIDSLLEQSDYVVLALPDTKYTRGIITEERIGKMKHDAIIINIGRGVLIDQDALTRALVENRIAGAGLDVMIPEPLDRESPLWGLPNVILTPHVSGNSRTTIYRCLDIFHKNLKNYVNNKPLENIVDFEAGY